MRLDVQKYFGTSTIHGLVYTTKQYHLVERLFWIITLILSAIFTSILIIEHIIKVWNFPIVTYMSDESIPVSEVYFPAVTVCPRLIIDYHRRWKSNQRQRYERHTLKEILYEYEEAAVEFADERRFNNISYVEFLNRIENGSIKLQELGSKLLRSLQVVDLITSRGVFSKLQHFIPANGFLDDINEFYKEFTRSLYQIIFKLFHEDQEYVAEIITQWGLCFTYNIAFSHDLLDTNSTSDDFHYIYSDKMFNLVKERLRAIPPKHHPLKISTAQKGLWVGFEKDLSPPVNPIQYDYEGYLVLLHNPFELPSKSSKFFIYNRKFQNRIWITPQINSIDESLLKFEPSERNCYIEDEKTLKFFKIYTKNNCENECLADFVLGRCGCVEFFMIRNSSTRICSASERNCFKQAETDFEAQIKSCECYDPCYHIVHEFEINTAGYANTESMRHNTVVGFQMQYKSSEISQLIRKRQFTVLDFLSFVGGILGLFAGFSALSFVELVYWFTVRVFINKYWNSNSKTHADSEEQDMSSRLAQVKASFQLYFSESSVHGIGYIFDSSRISGLLWTLFILTSMTLCFHMIQSTQDSVPDSRVIAIDDSFKPLSDIPFPAVTLVPSFTFKNRLSSINFWFGLKRVNKYDTYNETTFEDYKRRVTRFFLCIEWYEAYRYHYNFSFAPYVIDVMKLNSQIGWFRGQFSSFNGNFLPEFAEIRTIRGMGFTFNIIDADEMLNFNQISSRFNYTRIVTTEPQNLTKISNFQKYPLKFQKTDRAELTIKIKKPVGNFEKCIKQSLLIHHYDMSPTFAARNDFTEFEYGTILDVIVTPEIIRTDKNLRKLKPLNRGCYFDGEKTLNFFKKYSQMNCEIECVANLTLKTCGCVVFDQPFRSSDDICINISRTGPTCINNLKSDIYMYPDLLSQQNCACLPLCNSISYNIKFFTMHEKEEKRKYSSEWQYKFNETTINVRMNMDIILYRRYQQFTSSDVVSYVGGLLGLFAGISMLSIVEFFYFFTVRFGVDLWRMFRARLTSQNVQTAPNNN